MSYVYRFFGGRVLSSMLSALALCLVFFAPKEGAAKGFILITHGDDISHVADIPPQVIEQVKQSTGAANPAIGYKYGAFGIFFVNIWTWGGEYVVFENDTFWDLGAEGAAQMLGVGVGDLPKPITYTFPPGLIILVLLAIGFLLYVFVFSKGDDDAATAAAQGGMVADDGAIGDEEGASVEEEASKA